MGQKRAKGASFEQPKSAGQLIDEAVSHSLDAQGRIVGGQLDLFPGLKSGMDLYQSRIAEPIPLQLLGDIEQRFRGEQALRSPGSTQSPAASLAQAVKVQALIENERQRAAQQYQQMTSPFMLNPIQPGQAVGVGQEQDQARLNQSNLGVQSAQNARAQNRQTQSQRSQIFGGLAGAAGGGLIGARLMGQGPFSTGASSQGGMNPQQLQTLLAFSNLGSGVGSNLGLLF